MHGVQRAHGRTVGRYLAAAVAAVSLFAIPAVSALATPSPTPTPTPAQTTAKSGISLQLGGLSLNLPLALSVPGLLQIGDAGSSTPVPPSSSVPPPTSTTPRPTSQPPTTSAHPPTPPQHTGTSTSSVAPPPQSPGNQFNPPPPGTQSSSRASTPPSSSSNASSSPAKERPEGTGSLVLMRLDNGGEVMIAVLLAVTAVAVIIFARLGGVRRRRPGDRQH